VERIKESYAPGETRVWEIEGQYIEIFSAIGPDSNNITLRLLTRDGQELASGEELFPGVYYRTEKKFERVEVQNTGAEISEITFYVGPHEVGTRRLTGDVNVLGGGVSAFITGGTVQAVMQPGSIDEVAGEMYLSELNTLYPALTAGQPELMQYLRFDVGNYRVKEITAARSDTTKELYVGIYEGEPDTVPAPVLVQEKPFLKHWAGDANSNFIGGVVQRARVSNFNIAQLTIIDVLPVGQSKLKLNLQKPLNFVGGAGTPTLVLFGELPTVLHRVYFSALMQQY
jgi:hypothetical protein